MTRQRNCAYRCVQIKIFVSCARGVRSAARITRKTAATAVWCVRLGLTGSMPRNRHRGRRNASTAAVAAAVVRSRSRARRLRPPAALPWLRGGRGPGGARSPSHARPTPRALLVRAPPRLSRPFTPTEYPLPSPLHHPHARRDVFRVVRRRSGSHARVRHSYYYIFLFHLDIPCSTHSTVFFLFKVPICACTA